MVEHRLAWLVAAVMSCSIALSGINQALAKARTGTLIVIAGLADNGLASAIAKEADELGYAFVELPANAIEHVGQLKGEIEKGSVFETGPGSPPRLNVFSKAVLAAVPDIFSYRHVRVISEEMVPLEMVRQGKEFLGDVAEIVHEFPTNGKAPLAGNRGRMLPLSRYFIDAVIGMPPGVSRAGQDIVQLALKLENEIPVELSFGGGTGGRLAQLLARDDLSILHLDTHGGPGGRAIQISRSGAMLDGNGIPDPVRVPVVLLFGCEGVAARASFGSVLRARGAEAVISSIATFESFGLTGDAKRERLVYEAFFSTLRSGETIGKALVSLRQAAKREGRRVSRRATLTRLLFVLVGRDDLAFAWPRRGAP